MSSPPENPVPLGAGMNGGKITPHTIYDVAFERENIMKSFNEWLLNESNNIANKPQYHNIEILGWSLSKGTLPPWGFLGDAGIDITSVFAGRASDPESTKVYVVTNVVKMEFAKNVIQTGQVQVVA